MDQLPTDQQEALRRTNTGRLGIMAAKTYDVGDDELETMDRTALLEVKDIAARRGAASGQKSGKSDHIREMKLQLELKRMDLENKRIDADSWQKKAKLELRRIKAETESKQIEAETENKRIELQNEREKREHELRVAEAGRPAERGEQNGYVDQNMEEDGGERGRPRMEPRRRRVQTIGRSC